MHEHYVSTLATSVFTEDYNAVLTAPVVSQMIYWAVPPRPQRNYEKCVCMHPYFNYSTWH